MNLVFDKDRCAKFAADILGTDKQWGEWFSCIGAERNGKLAVVAVFNDYTDHNIEITVASRGPWALRNVIAAAMRYAFVQLKVKRITAHIRASNVRALSAAERCGFVREGIARSWFGNEDAVMLGMLEKEARFL